MDSEFSDPLLKNFPILCYVLSHSQLDSISGKSHPQLSPEIQESVLTQFPLLNNPKLLGSMIQAIPNNLTQTQTEILSSVLPLASSSDHSSLAAASQLTDDNLGLAVGLNQAVVGMEKMEHEGYEQKLCEAQDHLIRVYKSAAAELHNESEFEVNEEVIKILKEAEGGRTVEKIELFGHQLRFLPEELCKHRGLTVLNLSHNQLEVIPDSIAGLQKLESLNVSSNHLQSLPDSIGLLVNLKVINVSGNNLYALPETITGCSSLLELDASFNNLLSLPINIGYGLVNLVKLSIHLNKICYLPASICQLRSLKYIDAHFNKLHGLPSGIGRLTNLEVLILSGNFNNLTEVPDSMSDLCHLRELDLSNNQIRALPDTFGRLEKLIKLNLDQNPMVIPPRVIVQKGAKAVKEYMEFRWTDLVAQKQKMMHETNKGFEDNGETGWFAWGSSIINNVTSGVVQVFSEYTGGGGRRKETYRDPWLYQQL